MTIAVGYLAKSAQVAGVTLSGATSFGFSQAGTPIDLRSDGELYAQVTPVIPANVEIDVETRDISSSIDVGSSGALSVVADKMTGGKTLSGTVTFSATTAVVTSVSRGTDINGQAVLRVSARINSANGSSSGLSITSV